MHLRKRICGAVAVLLCVVQCWGRECFETQESVLLLVSSSTSQLLLDDLVSLAEVCPISVLSVRSEADLQSVRATAVIDLLNSPFLSLAALDTTAHLINGNAYEMRHTDKLMLPTDVEMGAFASLLQWLAVERLCVFLSEHASDLRGYIDAFPGIESSYFFISEELDMETVSLLVRKQVKPQGFNAFLVMLPPLSTLAVFHALRANKFGDSRLSLILSRESARYVHMANTTLPDFAETGPVYLIESGCETAVTEGEFILCRIQSVLRKSPVAFTVMNVVQGSPRIVGTVVDAQVEIEGLVAHLGTTVVLNATKPILTISFNNGTLNPGNIDDGTSEPPDYLGVQLALREINKGINLLPYHNLAVFNVTLGLFDFDLEWALGQMKGIAREDLGLAMITCEYSGVSMGVYGMLGSLGYEIPQAGASNTSPALTSVKDYPLFARISMSDAYMSVLYGRMLQQYGWRNIIVIYCDDPWSVGLYNLIINETRRLGIEVRNKEEYRMLPTQISNSSDYLHVFQDIVTTKVRICILLLYGETLLVSLEALYDLGLRRGDLFFLATEWLAANLFEQEDEERNRKFKELCNGAVQFYPSTLVGEIGAQFASTYRDTYASDAPFYSCFYYDVAFFVAHAIDYLLASGGSYDSPTTLNRAMREARFRGCTGIVSVEEGKNDRSPMTYSISNARIGEDGSYEVRIVGTYDPAGMILFNFTEPLIWPDNTTKAPEDIRRNLIDCPFEEKQIVTYVPGVLVAYLALAVLAVISVAVTAFIWRKWWNLHADVLIVRSEISFDDYMLFATIFIESFQYSAMGPNFPSWAVFMSELGNSLSVNMETFVKLKHGMFWTVLNATLGGICAWVIFLLVIVFHLDLRFECLCSRVGELGEKVLPLLGNMCFLPIVSTLMNVFQCPQAVDQGRKVGFQDTFLQQDCYQSCWTSPHIYYSIAAVFGIFLYLPMAVFLRPAWQRMQPYLHIKTSPSYLMLKTIYQISIIVLNKTLKNLHDLGHAISFLLLTSLFCGFTTKWRPYGYDRPNLWHLASLGCVLWLTLLTLIDLITPTQSPGIWIGLLLFGIFVIVVISLIWQVKKTKSMLFRPKGIHVVDLFKFMFSRGTKYLYLFKRNRRNEPPPESERQLARQVRHVVDYPPTFAPEAGVD